MINAAVPPTPKPTSSNLEKPIAQVAVKTPSMTRDCIMPPANNQNRSDRNSDLMNKTGDKTEDMLLRAVEHFAFALDNRRQVAELGSPRILIEPQQIG